MEWSPAAIAFALTLFAGLATGIGSVLALFARTTNTRFLSAALGFSAGVMIYVSFVEILSDARASLAAELGSRPGAWAAVLAFFRHRDAPAAYRRCRRKQACLKLVFRQVSGEWPSQPSRVGALDVVTHGGR